jgi:leucyl-tRNA synthetase
MSKSRGNVVNPDRFIDEYGSDTFRMYMMFMGNYADGGDWSDEGIVGIHRFLNRIWRLVEMIHENKPTGNETQRSKELERIRHYTAKMVTHGLENFHFNTAISRLMELVNEMYLYIQEVDLAEQNKSIVEDARETLILLLAPFAPHLAEELWDKLGHDDSIFNSQFPGFDEDKIKSDSIPIVIQVNGKVRENMDAEPDTPDDVIIENALALPKIQKYTAGKKIIKTIVVKNKLVNLVVR